MTYEEVLVFISENKEKRRAFKKQSQSKFVSLLLKLLAYIRGVKKRGKTHTSKRERETRDKEEKHIQRD